MAMHELSDLVSPSTIALRLDVGRSTVSNWTKRSQSFPAPLSAPGLSSDVYSWKEVSAWHRRHIDVVRRRTETQLSMETLALQRTLKRIEELKAALNNSL